MFRLSSLPSVPGLSSDPPKLAFRNAANGLARLSRSSIPLDENSYWKQYWELFDSVEDVNTLITPQHIRTALPENTRTLVTVLATHFIRLVRAPTFPRPAPATFALPTWGAATTPDDVRAVLNCARVIARVLPVLWEDEGDAARWLWAEGEEQESAQAQFVIEDDDEDDADAEPASAPAPAPAAATPKRTPSLLAQFITALVDSLFHAGFTLPADAAEGPSRTQYLIWAAGVGASSTPPAPAPLPAHRSTLLLALLAALSHPLYAPPAALHSTPAPALAALAALPRKTHLALLCSLLNTALTPPPAHYLGQVPRDEDLFPQRAAQALLVLLCADPDAAPNVYQRAVAKLHRERDFEFILDGVRGALDADAARGGLVNGVTKAVPVGRRGSGPGALEVWLLLWRVIDLNRKFTAHLLASTHLPPLLAHLFTAATTHKDSPPHFALLRTLAYLLQTLSAHRAFALALSSPLPHSTSTRAGDALVNAVYALIAGTNGAHAGLYQPLLIALGNVAPYVKGLSVQSAGRLAALFQAFASPQFLLADEGNPRCVFWMLEFFTHIIHHQLSDNPNLIYALLRAHDRFHALATFTLGGARAEIARAKAAREEHLRRTAGTGTPDQKRAQSPEQIPEDENANGTGDANERENGNGNENDRAARAEKERVRDREETIAAATTTPPEQNPTAQPNTTPPNELSEKARGKLRARSPPLPPASPSLGLNLHTTGVDASALLGERTAGGGSGFVPTEAWVASWVQGLPLDSILIAVSELLPKIQAIPTPARATSFLASATLLGILPPAPPIAARRFQWTERSAVWRAALLWGEVYVASGPGQGPWGGTMIRLFGIKQAPLTRRDQAIASVTSAVGNMWSAVGGGGGGQGRRGGVPPPQGAGAGSPRDSRDFVPSEGRR